mgnify:CR=1 FL=1
MWSYDKRLQFPVKIKNPNPQTAKIVISQLGGPDGELGASMRYLNQRYAMPYKECKGILTDIGTEELAHMEMISAIVYQLTRNLTPEQIKEGGFDAILMTRSSRGSTQKLGSVSTYIVQNASFITTLSCGGVNHLSSVHSTVCLILLFLLDEIIKSV